MKILVCTTFLYVCSFAHVDVGAVTVKTYSLNSTYQKLDQEIRVLVPEKYNASKKYRVLYVLPVECGFEQRFGYGLGVLQEMKAQDVFDIIIVQMGFEKEPWFGDHVSDPLIRQASYLKEFVVPFIEKNYSTFGTAEGRLLLGFSKSGWGAFSLILKYPDFFGYAAAWDSPMLFDDFHYGMKQIYGTPEQLARYRPDKLIPEQKEFFQKRTRLVLTGETAWGRMTPAPGGGSHTVGMHELMEKNGVKHLYDNTLKVPHRWDKAWVEPTLKLLMSLT